MYGCKTLDEPRYDVMKLLAERNTGRAQKSAEAADGPRKRPILLYPSLKQGKGAFQVKKMKLYEDKENNDSTKGKAMGTMEAGNRTMNRPNENNENSQDQPKGRKVLRNLNM